MTTCDFFHDLTTFIGVYFTVENLKKLCKKFFSSSLRIQKCISSLSHCLLSFHHIHCTALSCVCRRSIRGRPGSSWPQRMTIVSCVTPPSVHWQLHRPTIRARTTPRNYGSLRPNRTPITCRFKYRKVLHYEEASSLFRFCIGLVQISWKPQLN